jgi:hypothetical protein
MNLYNTDECTKLFVQIHIEFFFTNAGEIWKSTV